MEGFVCYNKSMKTQDIREHLASRFNKYQEYRDGKKSPDSSQPSQFSEKIQETKQQQDRESSSGNQDSNRAPIRRQHKSAPQLARAQPISDLHAKRLASLAPMIQDSAMRNGVPVELICGVILQESGGNARAKSPAGAEGVMQLMPATAKRFGVTNSYDAAQNIEGGTKYLKFLLDRFKGDVKLAVAAYNAGEGAVEKHGNKIPPYRETQNYVPKVLGYTQSMINILVAQADKADALPSHARRV